MPGKIFLKIADSKFKLLLTTLFMTFAFVACSGGGGGGDSSTGGAAGTGNNGSGGSSNSGMIRDFKFTLPMFSAGSAWNQSAAGSAALAESEQRILTTYRALRGDVSDQVTPDGTEPFNWPFIVLDYDEFAITVFRAGEGQHDVLICDYQGQKSWPSPKFPDEFSGPGGPVSIPNTAGQVIPSGPANREADGWTVVYDQATNTAYDFWQATTVRDGDCHSRGAGLTGDEIIETGAIEQFDMAGDGANPDGISSAHAVGTPLLAGLLMPEDIESGAISHALAFAIAGPRNKSPNPSEPDHSEYFYPASTTETNYYSIKPNAMIAGQRIRLKATIVNGNGEVIDESGYSPVTSMFLKALREYGAYLIDNASGFSFYAEDIHTGSVNLDADKINALIGHPTGTPLPTGKTKWQILMEKIAKDMDDTPIPIAYGPWNDGQDPATATVEIYNFEVIEPATRP